MRISLAAVTTIICTACLAASAQAATRFSNIIGPTAPPAPAPTPAPTPTPTPLPTPVPGSPGRYINPFSNSGWQPSRIDMGVDWIESKRLPVKAIGKAVILGAQNHAGWPGHHIIWYQLLGGTHAGDIIYVAEHLKNLAKAGTVVKPGQQIATALPGYPWTEWGWADTYGSPRAYPCYKEGHATNSGREMARFMVTLGARLVTSAGAGANSPKGRRC